MSHREEEKSRDTGDDNKEQSTKEQSEDEDKENSSTTETEKKKKPATETPKQKKKNQDTEKDTNEQQQQQSKSNRGSKTDRSEQPRASKKTRTKETEHGSTTERDSKNQQPTTARRKGKRDSSEAEKENDDQQSGSSDKDKEKSSGSNADDEETRGSRDGNATSRRSSNKIYRTPPTPLPEELFGMERSFTLDCIAVNTTSNDYARARPKLGPVIPPYNAQKDRHIRQYFRFIDVDKTLKKTGQAYPGTSIDGPVMDRFHDSGAGYRYISLRNQWGAGHSREAIYGHAHFLEDVVPLVGSNGRFGYRRNTPALRQVPSPFGVATTTPIH